MSSSITLQVGPVALELVSNDSEYISQIEKQWGSFKATSDPKGKVIIKTKNIKHSEVIVKNGKEVEYKFMNNVAFNGITISAATPAYIGDYDMSKHEGEIIVSITSKEDLLPIRNFIRMVWGLLLLKKDCLLMHASGINNNGNAFIFTGKPLQGKSTIAKKNLHLDVYGDECIGILLKDNKAFMIPTFFGGELDNFQKPPVPLRGVCLIEKNLPLSLTLLPNTEGYYGLLQNNMTYLPFDKRSPEVYKELFSLTKKAKDLIKVYKLTSKVDDNIWEVLDEIRS